MSTHGPISKATKQPDAGGDRNSRTVSGAASVEIVGFPQALYVRTFGDPDTLFVPLLDATREAFKIGERLQGQGEDKSSTVSLCAMHLASSLLRDSQFSIGARGLSPENTYTVDFAAGTLHMTTRLYSVVNRRTSFFRIELAGNIEGGLFVVRDPTQGTVITQVDEEKLRQSNYFANTLPNECVRSQLDRERFGQLQNAPMPEASGDLRMLVNVLGKDIPVVLRKQIKEACCDIIDGRQQEWVGSLSPEMNAHLIALTEYVRELFAK
jgi:hypothetical protein